jgi:hypothetical protein
MPARIIKKRVRFFVACEGESEQSFITWLQDLSRNTLHIHLDGIALGGGGFKSMLQKAVALHKRKSKNGGEYRDRFLIVDSDRTEQGDWSVEKMKSEAAKEQFTVCFQVPNHEGLLLRMISGMECDFPDASSARTKLKSRWAAYEKVMNARALGRQFSEDDLIRAAKSDPDLRLLLTKIGMLTEA